MDIDDKNIYYWAAVEATTVFAPGDNKDWVEEFTNLVVPNIGSDLEKFLITMSRLKSAEFAVGKVFKSSLGIDSVAKLDIILECLEIATLGRLILDCNKPLEDVLPFAREKIRPILEEAAKNKDRLGGPKNAAKAYQELAASLEALKNKKD